MLSLCALLTPLGGLLRNQTGTGRKPSRLDQQTLALKPADPNCGEQSCQRHAGEIGGNSDEVMSWAERAPRGTPVIRRTWS